MITLNIIYELLIHLLFILFAESILYFAIFQPVIKNDINRLSNKVKIDLKLNIGKNLDEYLNYYNIIEKRLNKTNNNRVITFLILLFVLLLCFLFLVIIISKIYKIKLHYNYLKTLFCLGILISLEVLFIILYNLKLKINNYEFQEKVLIKTKNHINNLQTSNVANNPNLLNKLLA